MKKLKRLKRFRPLLILLLVAMLQIGTWSQVLVSYADPGDPPTDVTTKVGSSFITGVDLKEIVGGVPGDSSIDPKDLEKTTQFFLMYEFDIPNKLEINAGDYIRINVPKEISLPIVLEGSKNGALKTQTGIHIANFHTDGNDIIIVFTNEVLDQSEVGGGLYIAAGFNQSEINTNGDKTDIEFDLPKKTITLEFIADPPLVLQDVAIQKSGQRAAGTDIEWKVTIDNQVKDATTHYTDNVLNATIVDTLPDSQELDETSVKVSINGAAVISLDSTKVDVDGTNKMTLDLGDIIIAANDKVEVTFVTKLKDTALEEALAADPPVTSILIRNKKATLTYGVDGTTSSGPAEVPIPIKLLNKSGVEQSATTGNNSKKILWTIEVNEDELEFNKAFITDTLPDKVTYITGSAKKDGNPITPDLTVPSVLKFSLGDIKKKVTITYETEIDPQFYKKNSYKDFVNSALLSWDGLAAGSGVTAAGTVGVRSGLFGKSGDGYNRANGVISWTISINEKNIRLAAPTITDVIPSDQVYIQGSATIVGDKAAPAGSGFNYVGTTLSYTFGDAIDSHYTIRFDTKPASTELITANGSGEFENKASFISGDIEIIDEPGTQEFTSNVFKKEADKYDKASRVITWKFIVNENGKDHTKTGIGSYAPIVLDPVVITDVIPDGLEFVEGKTKVLNSKNVEVTGLVAIDNKNKPEVKFTFNQPITEQYTIVFETKVVDEKKFTSTDNKNNGNFSVTNDATLTHNKTTTVIKDDATQEIKNRIVSKKGIATKTGEEHIDWVVYINSNAVDLNALLDVDKFWLIDSIKEGLIFDTTSVKLVKFDEAIEVPDSIASGGADGLGAGTNITIDGTNIKYNAETREFRFNFPIDEITGKTEIKHAYKLTFTTYIDDKVTERKFTNGISLHGSKGEKPVAIEEAYKSEDNRTMDFALMGTWAYSDLGSIIVNKVDVDHSNRKLDATFALYDQYGNEVQRKTTVDGKLEFSRVKIGLPFYVKEVKAPIGYLLSGAVSVDNEPATLTTVGAVVVDAVKVELKSANNKTPLELTFKNQKIRAKVEFIKQFEQPLKAFDTPSVATFKLSPSGSTPVDQIYTAKSDSDNGNKVLFENVKYGTYNLSETDASFGYLNKTATIDTITVTTNGATVNLNSTDYPKNTVTNELIKTNIKFYKKDGSNKGLIGAKFTLYKDDKAVITTTSDLEGAVTSDENGLVEFKDVLAGTYKIRETKAPFGYVPRPGDIGMDSITVAESDHNKPIVLADVTNVLIQAGFGFEKIESRNGDPLAGAIFGLYNSVGAELVPPVRATSDNTTGKVTFTNVGKGSYIIKEVKAPTGYELNPTEYKVSVTDTDHTQTVSITVDGQATPVTKVVNQLIEADVTFTKLSDKSGMGGKGLQGAKFHLKPIADEPLYPILYPTEVYETVSNADGIVLFENVPYGKYELYEDAVPTGYNLISGVIGTVTIDETNNGSIHPLNSEGNDITTVTNKIIKGDVEFEKVDKVTGLPLRNAHFGLYAKDDTKFDKEIAAAVSDDAGIVRFNGVEYGDYTIVEIASPAGYYLSKDTLDVSIIDQGVLYRLAKFENEKMPDKLVEGTIQITKLNTLDTPLAGAKFALYNVMGALVGEAVTNSSGIARFSPLVEGVYTVKELEAPKKYVKSDQVETVVISLEQSYEKLTFVNERSADAPWPGVEVQKTDDAGNVLAGVKFGLYQVTDATFTAPIAISVTDANGVAAFTNVIPGKYVVKEMEALEGYIMSDAALSVTVADDQETYNAGTVVNRVIRGDVVVNKVDSLKEPLAGAQFGLFDLNGKLVKIAVSDNDGIANLKGVSYGSYVLREMAAPESYEKSDEEVAINILIDGSVQTYTFVNRKVIVSDSEFGDQGNKKPETNGNKPNGNKSQVGGNELPKAGDSISTMIWLFVGSGLAITALLVTGRRRARKQ